MTTLTIEIPDRDTDLVKQILKKFKVKIKEEKNYDTEFVAQVNKGVRAMQNGEPGVKVDMANLWK